VCLQLEPRVAYFRHSVRARALFLSLFLFLPPFRPPPQPLHPKPYTLNASHVSAPVRHEWRAKSQAQRHNVLTEFARRQLKHYAPVCAKTQ
jgi:hypothetical protein